MPLSTKKRYFAVLITLSALTPATALACACGCGVFDVGTASMLPTQPGGMTWMEYDFMNQNDNYHGTSSAPAADNPDKNLRSNFLNAGAEYMFDRDWGAEIMVPYTFRHFVTDEGGGDIERFDHSSVGDIHVEGIYSGFSPDMSTGVTFGLKLPTGDFSYYGFDRDTEIGSGSTDILLGAYHMGNLTGPFNWFANGQLDAPVLTSDQYRPGNELDAAAGIYYNKWVVGGTKIAPLVELENSYRLHDRGQAADSDDSGYERVLLAPGVEVDSGGWRIYGDVGLPVYQHMKGDQLTAAELFKLNISHSF